MKDGVEKERPVESEEMRPAWFVVGEGDPSVPNDHLRAQSPAEAKEGIPLHSMWLDDEHWYPCAFADQRFRGYFLFRGHDRILKHEMRQATEEERRQYQIEEDRLTD